MRAPLAITLDLDDTLWPVAPAIERAEAALDAWLVAHAPRSAARWPREARRALREAVDRDHPDAVHDMTLQRRRMLVRLLASGGDDPARADAAYEAFFAARCEVECYADSIASLQRLATRVPLAALSNGNACLRRIGLMPLFRFQLGAREHGAAKPAPSIFLDACARLGVPPARVLHVGDDADLDVLGAAGAGLMTCWLNRDARPWPHPGRAPDLEFTSLAALADWLDDALDSADRTAA